MTPPPTRQEPHTAAAQVSAAHEGPARKPSPITARIPVWRQISDDIRTAIETGHIQPGQQLPSETQLREQYGASVTPVRRAMEELRIAGLVVTEHGRGTIVREQTPHTLTFNPYIRRTPGAARFTVWDAAWQVSRHRLLRAEAGTYAPLLECPRSEPIFILQRHLVDPTGRHTVTHRLIQRLSNVGEIVTGDEYQGHTPAELYALLTQAGYTLTWTDLITNAHATGDDTEAMTLPRGGPVLVHTRATHSASGQVLAIEETRLPGHRTAIASSPLQ